MVVRKLDDFLVLFGDESGRKHDQIGTDGIECVGEPLRFQTQPLEPVHEIECQQHQLKERHIGGPRIGGNFAERIIVEQFPVVLFDRGARIVKEVDPPRVEVQIGDKHMVDVLLVFEQFELPGFDGVFGNWASHHNEAMRLVPFVMDVVLKFGHFAAIGQGLKAAGHGLAFERSVLFGGHDISAARFVEKFDDRPTIESRIQPETNSDAGDRGRHLVETGLDKMPGSGCRNGVPRPERPMPEFLPMCFEAEDRMVRTPAMFLGVVAHVCALLFAVHRNDDRVDIERQTGGRRGQRKQVRTQAVVKPTHLANGLGGEMLQKSAQRRLIWKAFQAQHFQKGAVVLKNLGLVDTPQTHNDGVEQRQNQFGRVIVGRTPWSSNMALKQPAHTQFVAKTLNQPHPTEVSDMRFLEGNTDFSGTFWHVTQNTLLGRFVSWDFLCSVPSSYPSIFQKIKWPEMALFAHN
jgi:hypothetical protein